MLASSEGKHDIVELLLRYGADPNLQNPVRIFGYLLVLQDLYPQKCIRTGDLSKSVYITPIEARSQGKIIELY